MKKLPAIVLAAGTAFAAPAFAETVYYTTTTTAPERVTEYYWDASTGQYVSRSTVNYDQPTTYVYTEPTTVTYVDNPIVVTAPYLTEDEAITDDVIDRIAADPSIHGRIGVDTYENKVTLSGRVGTPWQAEKAASHAQSAPGVREVDNQIRGRIGG
jgi:hypothetical protein